MEAFPIPTLELNFDIYIYYVGLANDGEEKARKIKLIFNSGFYEIALVYILAFEAYNDELCYIETN